jgi:large subunit ribosomal protein L16
MILSPKKTKFSKSQKGPLGGIETNSLLTFGFYGLQTVESGRITARQIEATRKSVNRRIKKVGKLWINIFPDLPVSSKPTEVRMGKGKGSVDYWCAKVRAGKILFEIGSEVSPALAREALEMGANKLPVKTKFIQK